MALFKPNSSVMKWHYHDAVVIKTSGSALNILQSIELIRFQLVSPHSAVINLLLLVAPLGQLLTVWWSGLRVKRALISACKVERSLICVVVFICVGAAGSCLLTVVPHFRPINEESSTHA